MLSGTMMNHSLLILAVLLCLFGLVTQASSSGGSIFSWACMAGAYISHLFDSDAICSANQMYAMYTQMKAANCLNCDKYFHCQGNYNAVYRCQRSRSNRDMAKSISACREWGQSSSDSTADMRANSYGRNGGNCASRYLCNYNCMWSPSRRTCSRHNC